MEIIDWDKIVEELGPCLYRYFCVRFDDATADDLTQECLLRLVRKIESNQYDPSKGTIKMYAFGIAHYLVLESRPRKPLVSVEEHPYTLESGECLERNTMMKDSLNKVREVIGNLSEIEQHVISLCIEEHISIKDVSIILQTPEGTIKSHIHRAKKKIKSLINKEVVL